MSEPTTQAGKRLLDELAESPLPGARYAYDVVSRRILTIEAEARKQHEASLRERGWADEYEVATAAAMNFGDGQREARADLAAKYLVLCQLIVSYADLTHEVVNDPHGDPRDIISEWEKVVAEARAAIREEAER